MRRFDIRVRAEAAAFTAVAAASAIASAGVHTEYGPDAGHTLATANIAFGTGSLDSIYGWHGNDPVTQENDVDLYQIIVSDPDRFSAVLVSATGTMDGVLFLFRPNGIGVTTRDNDFPSPDPVITGRFVPAAGTYYLGVSVSPVTALNAAGEHLWDRFGNPNEERSPDGPGASTPFAGWTEDNPSGQQGGYRIDLTGAQMVPAPGALAVAGCFGFIAARRRR